MCWTKLTLKNYIANPYYRKIFIPPLNRVIEEVWEKTPKPADSFCVWEEYKGVLEFMKRLRREFDEREKM